MQLESKTHNAARRFGFDRCAAWLLLAVGVLAACSPTYNWRTWGLADLPLQVQLPCKPDQTTRAVPMGNAHVALHAAGCEHDEVHWSVMAARLSPSENAEEVLAQWQQLSMAHMQAQAPLAPVVQANIGTGTSEKQQHVRERVFRVGAGAKNGLAHASWRVLHVTQEKYIVQAMVMYEDGEDTTTRQEARANFHDSIRAHAAL